MAALRHARSQFIDDVMAYAAKTVADQGASDRITAEDEDLLRSENAYVIAEFFFVIGEIGIEKPEDLKRFLERHNADMRTLVSDKDKRAQKGLLLSRVNELIFNDRQIARLVFHMRGSVILFDQSDLGRLLGEMISQETCRKTLIALSKARLLERTDLGQQVLVYSGGTLEAFFKRHLKFVADALKSA